MKYNIKNDYILHCVKIIKKLDNKDLKNIFFVKRDKNLYLAAINGHVMILYKISDNAEEKPNYKIAFEYSDLLDGYLKASKKAYYSLFDDDTNHLEFMCGNNIYIESTNTDVPLEEIIERGITVIKDCSFSVTTASSSMSFNNIESIFPNKNGFITFYGNPNNLFEPMIATWSEDNNFCAYVMPITYGNENNANDISNIRDFFGISE